jgi:transcriptional regulator with XRE-family HTH domain
MLRIFLDEKSKGLTKATLARRLGKAPEQITRWLASPGNLRLDTVSDILLAMRHELSFDVTPIELGVRRNEFHELASLKPTVAGNQENATITIRRASQSVEALHAN